MIKKLLLPAFIVCLLLSVHTDAFAAGGGQAGPITVVLNGSQIEAVAYEADGIPYLPLRAICESLGYEIRWAGESGAISALKGGENITMDLKNNRIAADGHAYYMGGDYLGAPAESHIVINDYTYLRADLFAEFGLVPHWDQGGDKITLLSIKKNAITISTVKQNSEDDLIEITIQYPRIEGLEDKAVQDSINARFEKEALQARDEGLKNADELRTLRQSEGVTSPNKYETYFDYSIKYNQNGLLSVVFSDYQYTGGAHGSTIQTSHTLDLKTGREYRIKDLMLDQADYVTFISTAVRDQISQKIRAGELDELTVFTAIKDDQDFYLSSGGLVVYFQQYEYFPYAAGIQGFPVEFSTLKDMLSPDFSFLYGDPRE